MEQPTEIAQAAQTAQEDYRERCRALRGYCGLRVYRITPAGYVLLCGSCTVRFEVECADETAPSPLGIRSFEEDT